MSRPFTAAMAAAVKAGRPIALLAQIDHPEGTRYYWTGVGLLDWDDQEWVGLGTLGKISPIKYSTELAIQELVFEVSGIPVEDERWLTENIRNRDAFAWLAALNKRGEIIRDPKRIVRARLDFPRYSQAEDGTVGIQLVARTGFYTLERALDEVHSAEDQRDQYPDDSGCDLIPSLQQPDQIWAPA